MYFFVSGRVSRMTAAAAALVIQLGRLALYVSFPGQEKKTKQGNYFLGGLDGRNLRNNKSPERGKIY